ncbi:MAG: STAS domain-containing protein [Candidatus Rokuibacteriota bacterium]
MELAAKRFADTVALFPARRLDHSTADTFKAALAPHLAACTAGGDRVVIDLAGVEYISSVGLRMLMLASKQVKAQGGALAVADLQPVAAIDHGVAS